MWIAIKFWEDLGCRWEFVITKVLPGPLKELLLLKFMQALA